MNKWVLGVIIGLSLLVLVFLANSGVRASPTDARAQGNTIYTFWGTETCPAGWGLIQRGLAGTQTGGSTICIDINLPIMNSTTSTLRVSPAGWSAGMSDEAYPNNISYSYNSVSCVVCEKKWIFG